jgi:hypothetical protein
MPAKPLFVLISMLLVLSLAACTLPVPSQLTPEVSPSPNLTMTAVYGTPFATQVQPTSTLPGVITATSQPTSVAQATKTSVPPTNTLVPPTNTPPTNTPIPPTNTPLPPTATVDISRRPGTTIPVVFMSTQPTLNGDWTDFPAHDYAIPFVVFGKSNWTGSDDLAASYRIGWDKNNLYIAAKVHDDIYAQNATGENIFKGDSLELLLDTNVSGDFYVQQTDGDDYQLGMSFGKPDVNGTKEAWLWQPTGKAGSRTQVKIAATRNESAHLTRVEVIIPWSVFGVTPKSGMHLGFALSVSDNDNTSSNVQQTMISTAENRGLFDPTTWGDLQLK